MSDLSEDVRVKISRVRNECLTAIKTEIEAEVAAEREACAKIAEAYERVVGQDVADGEEIAARIRARQSVWRS